ncbi:MAG TPA: DUF2125 domain-containing protein [Stellaceae bacterium]|nr:DUF2125 domain-containing protein [Stellaceae bacterium]
MAGEGNFTLDAELQPSGSVAATIDGYDQLLTALSVAGLARASDLTQMKIGLAMIGPAISTYFTVTDGDAGRALRTRCRDVGVGATSDVGKLVEA